MPHFAMVYVTALPASAVDDQQVLLYSGGEYSHHCWRNGAWRQIGSSAGDHPNLDAHETLGLATQAALDTHAADTTAIHGIADTANLVLTNDARLSDARTPLTHSITSAHNGFPGGSSTFLRADGTFAAPTAAAADLDLPETGSLTVATAKYHLTGVRHQCTGSQRITVAAPEDCEC